jgi:ABC-type multidrug transport system fused ATPase/permease subunit
MSRVEADGLAGLLGATRAVAALLLGRRGVRWLLLSTAGWLAQGLVEWGMAGLLLLFLHSIALIGGEGLPAWLPEWLLGLQTLPIWLGILGLTLLQSGLQVLSYQGRVLITERANARLRMLLTRCAVAGDGPPSLSRLNYYGVEVFPRSVEFFAILTNVMQYLALALALALAMCVVAWPLALVALAGIAVFASLVLGFNLLNHRHAARLPLLHQRYEQDKVRVSRNWLFVRAIGLQREETARQLHSTLGLYQAIVRAFFWGNLGTALGPLFATSLLAAVVMARAALDLPTAALLPFLYLLFRFQQMLSSATQATGGLFTFGPLMREAARFLAGFSADERARALAGEALLGADTDSRRIQTLLAADPTLGHPSRPTTQAPELVFTELEYCWPGAAAPVFSGLSQALPAGAMLGIAGPNGAGKSTLLALLLGLLQPARGRVEIDGLRGSDWMSQHRAGVAFVGADPHLVAGSVRENLCYGLSREVSDAELRQILDRVGLAGLRDGLNQPASESGEGLSAGERQRLSIARALLRRPRLLLLDEPTAHIDIHSRRLIIAALAGLSGQCTRVMISHDSEVLRGADAVLHLGGMPETAPQTVPLEQVDV